jgi:hypothetical protein
MKTISHPYKTFAFFANGNVSLFYSKEFELYEDSFISINGGEATPIEDYGDYVLSKKTLSADTAFD